MAVGRTQKGHKTVMDSYEEFLHHLREALSALYDPATLRRNPLRRLLGTGEGVSNSAALRDLLIAAIESLRPAHETPAQARAWRIYDLLHFRFVQQFGPDEVADQLGISARHLRREQHAALEALAARLQERYLPAGLSEPPAEEDEAGPQWRQELAWLQDAPPEQGVNLQEGLPAVLALVEPLAQQHQVALELQMDNQPLDVAMHPVALRQILLSVLDAAIHAGAHGRVLVTAQPAAAEIVVRIACAPGTAAYGSPDAAELRMTRRLARLCGCVVDVSTTDERFAAHLLLPALGRLPVLVIDDNPDTLELLRRYAAGTRYQILVTRDPDQALGLVQQIAPQIIVLDVMMPQVDGWEVLGRLRQHPRTGQIPVVVCSILTQEELALTLGASGFVQKPVTRQDFLAALDRLTPLEQSVPSSQLALN